MTNRRKHKMKNWIIKILTKIFLPSKVKDIFDKLQNILKGKKSYLAGAVMILQGIILTLEQFSELKGISEIVEWIKQFLSSEGTVLVMQGLAIMGIRAGISKQIVK